MNLFEKLASYANGARILADWLGSGGHVVHQNLAQDRADTCGICPHNKAGVKVVESASQAIKEQVELKNHLQLRVSGEKGLRSCELCDCPLRLKIWLPIERVRPTDEERDLFPLHCWLRKETA